MRSLPKFLTRYISVFAVVLFLCSALYAENVGVGTNEDFRGPVGLQMYSLRSISEKDGVESAVKLAAEMGFKYIEASRSFDLTIEEYQALLEKYGLKAGAKNWGVDMFQSEEKIRQVIHEARVLGIRYVGIAWFPHKRGAFSMADAQRAVELFNAAGKRLQKEGLTFVYHNHGYEFQPWEGGKEGETLFDYIIQNTDPKTVTFEMDVLWTIFPGADPAALLRKYPDRFALMHLKDLKKGVEGNLTGGTPVTNDVALGSGQANYPEILKAAQNAGVKFYFIEDESPVFRTQILESLRYLESVELK